ncbi:MAG: signal peptidase I [Desulfocapsaceae bacterium]|nr:signal peptidase I [Desulfocapsaceae bacterium]
MADRGDAAIDSRPRGVSKSKFREYTETIVGALALAFLLRTFIVQSFEIPSGSMENTLLVGDYLLANKVIYGMKMPWSATRILKVRDPQRGDIVIFRFPLDRSQDYIKRVVGVPGDEIQIRDKQVYVNGIPSKDEHEIHNDPHVVSSGAGVRDNFGPVRVPEHSFFMMGDNRDNSYDSRFWGFVKDSDIIGKAAVKFWSWDRKRWMPRLNRIGRPID